MATSMQSADDVRIALFKQRKPLVVQTGSRPCPDGTWEIGESDKGELVCSAIDKKPCEDINSNVSVVWSNPETNEEGLISRDGIVKCEWPIGVLKVEDYDRILLLNNGVDSFDELPEPPTFPLANGNCSTKSIPECLTIQSEKCPLDSFGTGEAMTSCTVLTAASTGFNVPNGSLCRNCDRINPVVYDGEFTKLCNTGDAKQECLCIAPGRPGADPVLSQKGVYDNMPKSLKDARGVWYSACSLENYRNTKEIRENKSNRGKTCQALDDYLRSTGVDFTDLKFRTTCYDNGGNLASFVPGPNTPGVLVRRYWWIIALVVIFLLIIIFAIAASHSSKNKESSS